MSDTPKFQPNAAAGGWGALHATAKALREQSALVKGGRSLLSMNQPDGFDCPSCAWPDPKHTSSFEFCENGAKAVAWETTEKRVTRDFFATWMVGELEQQSDYWLENQGRLTEPMRYDPAMDRYVPVSWDEAFALIARELRTLADPNEAEFYTSGRTSNEAAFLYQLFARLYGTNNMPDCSNMCHEPTSVGLPESIGIGKGTVVLEDFEHADAIFILGQNPGTNSPRMMTELHNASRRGAPIIVFNPLKERASTGAVRRTAGSDRDGDFRVHPDRQRILPDQGRGRCRRTQRHHEASARGGRRRAGCRPTVGPRYGVHRRAYRLLRGIRRRHQIVPGHLTSQPHRANATSEFMT
jgi:anaerobic selenocysteine-containing dehydrogenase